MAVMTAVLVPSLLSYVERSRAQRDYSAMSEVTNAVKLALADEEVYDELIRYVASGNMASYSDHQVAEDDYIVIKKENGVIGEYKTSDSTRLADEVIYSFDGNMEGVTLTFEPDAHGAKETIYKIEDAIINKGLQTAGNKHAANNEKTNLVQSGRTGESVNYIFDGIDYSNNGTLKSMPSLCSRLKSILGNEINAISQTYRNSDYTVFIRLGNPLADDPFSEGAIDVYGQYNGTNLTLTSEGTGAGPDSADRPTTPPPTPSKPTEPGGGLDPDPGLGGGGSTGGGIKPPKPQVIKVKKPEIKNNLTYNGKEQFPEIIYTQSQWTIKENSILKATNAGVYQIALLPNNGIVWDDGTESGSKNEVLLNWTINKKPVTLAWGPTTTWPYDGKTHSATCAINTADIINGDSVEVSLKGNHFGPNSGTYTVTAEIIHKNYAISKTSKTQQTHTIEKPLIVKVPKPFLDKKDFTYNKTEQGPTIKNFNPEQWDISGTQKAVGANSYTINLSPKKGIHWEDGSAEGSDAVVGLTWQINQKEIVLKWNGKDIYIRDGTRKTISCEIISGVVNGDDVNIQLTGNNFGPNIGQYVISAKSNNLNYTIKNNTFKCKIVEPSDLRAGLSWFEDIDQSGTRNSVYRNEVESIIIVKELPKPKEEFTTWWDASSDWNNSVIAAFDRNTETIYIDTIGRQDVMLSAEPVEQFAFFNYMKYMDLRLLNTTNACKMDDMFKRTGMYSTDLLIDMTGWDTSSVLSMSNMFNETGKDVTNKFELVGLNDFDVHQVRTMEWMFSQCGTDATTWTIGDLSGWDVSKVTRMYSMFAWSGSNAKKYTIGDLGNWNMSNVKYMSNMFAYTGRVAEEWSIGDLSNWNISSATNLIGMFDGAGCEATTWSIGDIGNWNTSNVESLTAMFRSSGANSKTFDIGNISKWDTSKVENISDIFYAAGTKAEIFDIGNIGEWDTSKITNMKNAFIRTGENAKTVYIGDLSQWNVSNVTNMENMFRNIAYKDANWHQDLSCWNISKVTNHSVFQTQNKIIEPNWAS